jgi:hypothetical protein
MNITAPYAYTITTYDSQYYILQPTSFYHISQPTGQAAGDDRVRELETASWDWSYIHRVVLCAILGLGVT